MEKKLWYYVKNGTAEKTIALFGQYYSFRFSTENYGTSI